MATQIEISAGLNALMTENNISNKKHLQYIGFTDCSFISPGAKLLMYNITDKRHNRYQSTVAYEIGY